MLVPGRLPYFRAEVRVPDAAADAVRVEAVSFSYARTQEDALESVSLRIRPGERVALIGPNGAGKSTLLKLMAGLLPPQRGGHVQIFGAPAIGQWRSAYLAQRSDVDWQFPVTVRDVALQGRMVHAGWLARQTREDAARADAALNLVGLAEVAARPIGDLSGGQQQRAFIARALVQQAQLLLLDEPFAGLDAPAQRALNGVLADLQATGCTIVISTHDLAGLLAGDGSARVVLLRRSVLADGPSAVVLRSDVLAGAYA